MTALTAAKHPYPQVSGWLVAALLAVITFSRLGVIALSPLGPGVDEAQYWLWGQTPQLGYYSKPPLIAWLLGLIDALAGRSTFSLRAPAPLLHLATALILWRAAAVMAGARAGCIAALLWLSLPAVALGSFVISTDSLLLPFWSGALYCLIRADRSAGNRLFFIVCAGLLIGLASLAKYAGLYFAVCFGLWLTVGCRWHGRDRLRAFVLFVLAVALASSPTWIWNLGNEFVTVQHLGENANLQKQSFSPVSVVRFLAEQAGVFGPLTLIMLVLASLAGGRDSRRLGHAATPALGFFIWPIIALLCVQAFVSEANANWAVSAYPAAVLVLSAAASTSLSIGIIINYVLGAVLAAVLAVGSFGDYGPASDPLRRLRGWESLAQHSTDLARQTGARTILAYSRASAALLHWHLAETDLAIVLMPPQQGGGNHYQRRYPLRTDTARPLLILTENENLPPAGAAGWQGPVGQLSTQISKSRTRDVTFWLAR